MRVETIITPAIALIFLYLGSNSNLIGFAELVRELDFVAGRQYQPTALSPDNLCPTDWDVNVTEKDWVSYGKDYPISDSDSD